MESMPSIPISKPSSRLKVLYVITVAERGGAQTHVAQLLHGFRHQLDAHLVVGTEGYLTEEASRAGVAFTILPSLVQPIHPANDYRALVRLRKVIRAVQPDLIHAHSSKSGLLARTAAWLESRPAVFTAHGWAFAGGTSIGRKAVALPLEWLAGRVPRLQVIAVSEYDRRLALRSRVVSPDRVRTIHNGIPEHAPVAGHTTSGVPTITMVARFSRQKDHELLLRALGGVDGQPKVQLVGSGPLLEQVRLQARALRSIDVQFLGDRSDVPELLSRSDIVVLASRFEGLPISIIEAMRAGLPVVATDVGGVSELVHDGVTGYLVPPSDVEALRSKIETLIKSPELRKKMGSAGRERFRERFAEAAMLQRTLEVYGQCA
jgi:glycosyltransferase involved in cell wall biosynthesis